MAITLQNVYQGQASSSNNLSVLFTTANNNDMIVIASCTETDSAAVRTVSGISGVSGATWAFRGRSYSASPDGESVEVWWAIIPIAGTYTALVSYSGGNYDDAAYFAVDISGNNLIWDTNSSLPAVSAVGPGVDISTTSSNPLVLAFTGYYNAVLPSTPMTPSWITQRSDVLNGGAVLWQYSAMGGGLPGAIVASATVGWTSMPFGTCLYVDAVAENAFGSSSPAAGSARARAIVPNILGNHLANVGTASARARAVPARSVTYPAPTVGIVPSPDAIFAGAPVVSPSHVRSAAVTPGDTEATFSWSAPQVGDPITGYEVEIVGVSTVSLSSTTFSYLWTGLTDGTTYTAEIWATNANGAGPVSTLTFTPSATPNGPLYSQSTEPTNLFVAPGDGAILVQWDPPATPGSPIERYNVVGGINYSTSSSQETSFGIPGLTDGTSYNVSVSAQTVAGAGQTTTQFGIVPASGNQMVTTPDPPISLTLVTSGDGWGIITWQAAAYTGGSPISSFQVNISPTPVNTSATIGTFSGFGPYDASEVTSAFIDGLTVGTAYTLTVQTANAAGLSSPSSGIALTPTTETLVAPAYVDGASTSSDTSSTLSMTIPSDFVVHRTVMILYVVGYSTAGVGVPSGWDWVKGVDLYDVGLQDAIYSSQVVYTRMCDTGDPGSTLDITVPVGPGGTQGGLAVLVGYSGVAGSGYAPPTAPAISTAIAPQGMSYQGATDLAGTNTMTTFDANCLLVQSYSAEWLVHGTPGTLTPPGGMTVRKQVSSNLGALAVCDHVQTTAGAIPEFDGTASTPVAGAVVALVLHPV